MTSIKSWGEILLAKVKKRHVMFRVFKIAIAFLIATILCQFPLHSLEFLGYDTLFRMKPQQATSNEVRLIGLDSKTYNHFNKKPSAKEHYKLLRNIYQERPKTLIYTIKPDQLSGSPEEKRKLASMMESMPNFMVAIPKLEVDANQSHFRLRKPFHNLNAKQAILSEDKINFGGDGVSRRAILYYQDKWFLHPLAAQTITGEKKLQDYNGTFDFKGSKQILTNTHRTGSFPIHSFIDIQNRDFSFGTFTNKIVLVGSISEHEASDYVQSAYSRDISAMPKLEYHANIIDTLITNNAIIQSPSWLVYLCTILLALITLYFTFRMNPVKGITFILASALAYFSISYIVFISFNFWLPLAHPLLALFITYYFFIPYRLINESKKSWEYQQKNKLLTQVEELKNNFISMMSHDLKTPIARIQGMAEMAANEKESLNSIQKNALNNIRSSTNELNQFITSILNLSRVESKGLNLNLATKDINSLIEEVIEKNRFEADQRNIEIIFEPEPLFATKVDVDLMRQVLHNLIENAIKYSPDNSKVLITSEEINGEICVQVSDQGIGIAQEELGNIFHKFYRTKNVKSSPTKGSGLGLYLSSYFIELHKGKIQVESEPEQGSTFTVTLPV